MRVLIAGCGYVGTELGLRLARGGHEVWGLRRNAAGLPSPIRPVSADLLDPVLRRRLPPADRVVYAAAPEARSEEAYRRIYVDGVRSLIAALAGVRASVKRFVLVSSTAACGGGGGEWVDEATPAAPAGFRGTSVLEGEGVASSAPFPAVVLRLAGIYGPGRGRLVERVRSGEARCPPGEPVWSNRIHRDDAADALAHLLALERPDSLYLGVDDEPSPLCEVYRYVAARLGVPPPPSGDDARAAGPSRRFSNARLKRGGFRFEYPSYREGYDAILTG